SRYLENTEGPRVPGYEAAPRGSPRSCRELHNTRSTVPRPADGQAKGEEVMAVDFSKAIERGTESGIEWALVNAPFDGAINGYAKLPDGHPWHDLDLQWNDCEVVEVHGGITYGPKEGWIGFDTVHAWDIWPGKSHMFPS